MEVWPAIDLRGGQCVRLQQGDYRRETVFGDDPVEVAQRWVSLGAKRLHLVDLDGARDGRPANLPSVAAIVSSAGVPCQLGGGIRNEQTITELLELGVQRVIIGTLAMEEPDWFRQMCRTYPQRLVLGIDARDGRVATRGWLQTSSVSAVELARMFASEPLAAIVYTDISRDGMLSGPNVAAISEMCAAVSLPVIASGGVSSREDIFQLAAIPAAGCIIGRALYEGRLSLAEAMEAAGDSR